VTAGVLSTAVEDAVTAGVLSTAVEDDVTAGVLSTAVEDGQQLFVPQRIKSSLEI